MNQLEAHRRIATQKSSVRLDERLDASTVLVAAAADPAGLQELIEIVK